MIIGLVGPLAAGKGTIVRYLTERYQAESLKFSNILRDIIDRLYAQQTREHMSHLGTWVRQEFSDDILVRVILKDLEKKSGNLFVLDGIRSHSEVDVLLQRQDFRLWAIEGNIRERYKRIIARGENPGEKQLAFEQFAAQHDLPSEQEIAGIMQRAHAHINNDDDVQNLYSQVDTLMREASI